MSQAGRGATGANAEIDESARHSMAAGLLSTIGLVLAPVAALLMILALIQAIFGIAHELSLATYPANPNGISTSRRDVTVLFNLVAGLAGPLAAALLWFDWIGSGIRRRSRISLIGYMCMTIAGMALFLIVDPYGNI
jgi:hypothetical protein